MRSLRSWGQALGSMVMVAALGACGGGGGGNDAPAPVPLTVGVTINGAAATADGNGQFTAKPGDKIEITPSQGADWTATSAPAGAITTRDAAIASAKWAAQLVNETSASASFTVSAKAVANASLTKDTVFNIRAADARNAKYRVFATNGSRQQLALNFDTMTYVMTDEDGAETADAFVADASDAGTYLFKSTRITATVNTAKFRLAANTVVGSFPFTRPQSTPTSYAVQPFIASNALVTVQADLDGIYNRLGINLSSPADSNIRTSQITAGGTRYLLCNEVAITTVANCPPTSVLTYAITPETTGSANYLWRITNLANSTDTGTFSIARVGGENVYLSAGLIQQTSGSFRAFRVGLVDSTALLPTTARGGDNLGATGTVTLDATTYSARGTNPDGSAVNADYAVTSIGAFGIWGINTVGTDRYFAIHSGKLTAVVSARGPIAGYIQLGLVD